MRIGVDFRFLSGGPFLVQRGMGRYAQQQLREVLKLDQKNEYLLLCEPGTDHTLLLPDIAAAANVRLIIAPWSSERSTHKVAEIKALVLEKSSDYQDWLSTLRLDLYHSTIPFNTIKWPIPDFDVCPLVANFYDTIPLIYPEVFLPPGSYAECLYHLALTFLKKAGALVTISESARQDAHHYAGLALEKAHLAYPVPDPEFHPLPRPELEARAQVLRKRIPLPEAFIFAVPSLDPHKNLELLFKGYRLLPESVRRAYPLVLGGHALSRAGVLDRMLAKHGLEKQCLATGNISAEELAALYNLAQVVVHPSRYEGFGYPVAEAMACGTPVITTTASSLPEVGGDAAVLVDPDDPRALAKELGDVLANPERRRTMREAGFKQLERFSGLALGQATLEAYAQAAGAPARKSSSKKRLALWTPLPPQASGVSDYSVELLEQLEVDYDIEVFVDHGYLPNLRLLDQHTLHDYSGFARRQKERPFDVIIYQLGASSFHAYMREAIERWPGLVVVHDLSWSYWIRDHFLKHGGRRGFEAELERQEGTQALRTYRDLHRLGWFIGKEALWHFLDHHYLLGEVIRKSRAMAVHLPHSQKALEQHYGVSGIHCLPLGTRDPWKGAKSGFRPEARAARQIDASTFVAGAFGLGSRGKRWDSILRAFAQFHQRRPDSLLLLVGAVPNQGYAREIRRWIVRLGLEMSVRWIDRADEEAFTEWMEVCDVVVNLRHPSRQQMSAVTCRALGAGKPLILTDLPEWDIFPSAVCLRTPPSAEEIPLLVEHFETLFQSPARRGEMGAAARTFYLQSFHPALAAREYRQLIEELSQPTRPDLKPGVGV